MEPREKLADLASERFRLQRCKAGDEARCKKIDEEMIELMLSLGEEKMAFDFHNATVVPSHQSTIDRTALILAGVDAKTIDACTKKTYYSFMKVTERKQAAGGEEEG